MNRSTTVRRGVAAGVAAAGLAVGGIGIASATDGEQDASAVSSAANAPQDGERPGPGGPGGRGGPGLPGGEELASALGVSTEELRAAFEAVREETDPPSQEDRSTPPSEADREQRQQELAQALAGELDGVSAEEVSAAMQEVRADHEAEDRGRLSDRLDEAVEAGDLTESDKASVLKAYDAGVLGGGPGPR